VLEASVVGLLEGDFRFLEAEDAEERFTTGDGDVRRILFSRGSFRFGKDVQSSQKSRNSIIEIFYSKQTPLLTGMMKKTATYKRTSKPSNRTDPPLLLFNQ